MLLRNVFIILTSGQIVTSPGCFHGIDWDRVIPRTGLKIFDMRTSNIVVQSLNSPFIPPHIGAEPGRAKEESRITCMRMLRTPPFFPPKSGEKPYLEVFSRFGLWRNFLNANIQATISAFRLIKNLSINPKSVEFHQCHAKHIRFAFFHNIKDNERKLCQDLLTIENTDSDLKVHALHYANELLVRVRLSFQKLLQNRSTLRTIRKNVWEKSNDAYSL